MTEKLRAWEMIYDQQKEQIVLHYLDVEWMKDGFACIAGETVSASKLKLTPEEAKAAFIERVENGVKNLEATKEQVVAGIKANKELIETAKKFPVLEAANALVEKEKGPAILLPKGRTH